MRLPELAATLEAYAARGAPAITEGPIAAAVELAARRHGGIIRAADLAAYRPVWRDADALRGLWLAGGVDAAAVVGGDHPRPDLRHARARRLGGNYRGSAPIGIHLLAEVWRRAYADRVLLGDPRTSLASAPQLLDPDWLDLRAAEIKPGKATRFGAGSAVVA